MATQFKQGGASAPPILPLDLLLSVVPSLPRPILSRLTARLIERLDELDGDPDAEQTGDEAEPDFITKGRASGPGCPISDPDAGAEDFGEDCQGGDACQDDRPIADPEAYRNHCRRLKRDRCYRLPRPRAGLEGWQSHELWTGPAIPTKRQILRRKRGMPRRPRA